MWIIIVVASCHNVVLMTAGMNWHRHRQLGYCRAVSDRTTFGWLCDVFVSPSARGQGIAKAMVGYILEHPEHQGLRRWLLATKDAHGIYRECGFESLPMPERWMVKLWDTSF